MLFAFVLALVAVLSAYATAVDQALLRYAIKSAVTLPTGWRKHSDPPPDHLFSLRFALRQSNFDHLEQELYQISDPNNVRWTQHLSKEQVEELVAPNSGSIKLVDDFLTSFGVDVSSAARSPARDWITFNVTVAQAERLLQTKYCVYEHEVSRRRILRTTEYSLPAHLHAHIDVVQPTNYFGGLRPHWSRLQFGSGLSRTASPRFGSSDITDPNTTNMTLQTLKDLYNTGNYTPSHTNGNKLGITGYLEQYANLADLKASYKLNLPKAAASTLSVVSVDGGLNTQNVSEAGIEANLDVQYGGGISHPIPNIFYTTYGRGENTQANISYEDNGNEPYDVFLLDLLSKNDSEIPQVLTTSYGEDENTVPIDYAIRVCQLYAQLGSRGVSAMHSSGDYGVGGQNPFLSCSSPVNRFVPTFPASCPYVTAVGGTFSIPEMGAELSGGGFSDYFARPSYQDKAISGFLQTLGNTYEGLYNSNGRGFPDVSAQSSRFEVVYQGDVVVVSGTSASAPTFSAVIALLNDVLIGQGRRPLGFLNPFIYTTGQAGLNDITMGNNPGCATTGFNATEGWDPVTGLGTPDFWKLKNVVENSTDVASTSSGGGLSPQPTAKVNGAVQIFESPRLYFLLCAVLFNWMF